MSEKHHYVPQCLLRAFTANDKEQIHVFDKATERHFVTSVRNVASETGFNEFEKFESAHSLEPMLGRMESALAPVLRQIVLRRDIKWLSNEHRIKLALFAAVQQMRVKSTREAMYARQQSLRKWIVDLGHDPREVEGFQDMDERDLHDLGVSLIMLSKDFAKYYYKKHWVLVRAPPEHVFYISDSPITLFNVLENTERGHQGLSVDGSQIDLPLSPTLMLSFVCDRVAAYMKDRLDAIHWYRGFYGYLPKDLQELEEVASPILEKQLIDALPENVEHHNSLQVIRASRFIFSANADFSLVKSMLAEHPSLKLPHAQRPENKTYISRGMALGEPTRAG